MLSYLVSVIKANKGVLSNMSYLTLLQLVNMVIPFFTYPYIIRVLGVDNYGLIVYSQAIIGYLVLLVSFGFNITGTKEISKNSFNLRKLSKIVSSIFVIKFLIFVFACIFLFIVLLLIPIENNLKKLLFFTLWMGAYEVFFPVFYFQGVEQMKFITLFNFIGKISFLILVFLFINKEEDLYYYPLFNGITTVLICFLSLRILVKSGVRLYVPRFNVLKYYILKSYTMALAYASNNLKTGLNVVLIKVFFGIKEVAYFDLAMKIVSIGNMFCDVLSQAIFPKIAREKNMQFLKKIIVVVLVLTLVFVVFSFVLGNYVIELLGGVNMQESFSILKITSFVVPFYALGGLLGRNCLIVFNKDRIVLKSMMLSSGLYLSLILLYYIVQWNSLQLFSTFFMISFMFETFYRYYYCKKEKLL